MPCSWQALATLFYPCGWTVIFPLDCELPEGSIRAVHHRILSGSTWCSRSSNTSLLLPPRPPTLAQTLGGSLSAFPSPVTVPSSSLQPAARLQGSQPDLFCPLTPSPCSPSLFLVQMLTPSLMVPPARAPPHPQTVIPPVTPANKVLWGGRWEPGTGGDLGWAESGEDCPGSPGDDPSRSLGSLSSLSSLSPLNSFESSPPLPLTWPLSFAHTQDLTSK